MARALVSVEVDPSGAPSAPRAAVELRLVWGRDLVAVEVVPPPGRREAVLRGADLRSAEMQACFEEVTLARATAEGSWELVLPDGSAAPSGTRLASRAGKAVLRASLVAPEELDLPREKGDGRVRRAVLGATVLHLAIVAFALAMGGKSASPGAYQPPLLAPLLAEAAGEAMPEGEAAPVTETTTASRAAEHEIAAAPGEAPPARFGMVGLAAGGARAPSRAARAFQAYEPEPAALAMFTPSIDEGVSAAGLALGAP